MDGETKQAFNDLVNQFSFELDEYRLKISACENDDDTRDLIRSFIGFLVVLEHALAVY